LFNTTSLDELAVIERAPPFSPSRAIPLSTLASSKVMAWMDVVSDVRKTLPMLADPVTVLMFDEINENEPASDVEEKRLPL
jgi:hypothetical protein